MPGLFHRPLSRKDFLRISAGSAAMGWLHLAAASPWAGAREDTGPDSIRVALLADTHTPADPAEAYRGFKPVDNLKAIVPQIVQAAPELVTLTGDAARLVGKREDYVALQSLLQPVAEKSPVVIGLGNHDDRQNFFQVFPADAGDLKQPVAGKHVTVFEHAALRLVMLDSLLYVNKVAGLLGKAQRQWLRTILPNLNDRPLVLFVHHTLGDGDGDLLDADRQFQLIEPHEHVKAIFFGHSHHWGITQRNGVKLINLPAVGYNFNDSEPVGWIDARFHSDGVALTLRAIAGNRDQDGTTTQVAWTR